VAIPGANSVDSGGGEFILRKEGAKFAARRMRIYRRYTGIVLKLLEEGRERAQRRGYFRRCP
jgi:hypothetical protein